MSTSITLNGLDVDTARVVMPYRGVWTADIDFDLAAVPVEPTGPAIIKVGTSVLVGTIDPNGSGKLGAKGRARVIGGAGGWHKEVPSQDFNSDAGVLSTLVLTTTAAQVGEKVAETAPSVLGVHYGRTKGPASRVLNGLDWHVDPVTGVTIVGPRVPIPAVPGIIDVLDWDPLERRASIASDEIVSPGTVLTDTRFGTATIVDVEQTFGGSGSRAVAWCSKSTSTRLVGALTTLVRETTRSEYLRSHTYRVVLQGGDGRLTLQALKLRGPVPDMLPIKMCMGVPGFDSKLTPGSEVIVEFADGDPTKPLVVGFAKGNPPPIEVSCDAVRIAFGLGTSPVAKSIEVITALNAIQAQLPTIGAALTAIVAIPLASAAAPAAGVATAAIASGASALSAALATLPSTRTFTD